MAPDKQSAFTLVEVLIAMAITAFVSMIAYSSISSVIIGVERLAENADRAYKINRAWMIISRDLRELAPRPVRDEFGQVEPTMTGGEAAPFELSFTRAGWHNPNAHPRSNLQRINYRLEDEALWRDTYFVLDRAGETEPESVKLLDDVESMELAFLSSFDQLQFEGRSSNVDARNWLDNWVTDTSSADSVLDPPLAIRIQLQLRDWGEMSRFYAISPL